MNEKARQGGSGRAKRSGADRLERTPPSGLRQQDGWAAFEISVRCGKACRPESRRPGADGETTDYILDSGWRARPERGANRYPTSSPNRREHPFASERALHPLGISSGIFSEKKTPPGGGVKEGREISPRD